MQAKAGLSRLVQEARQLLILAVDDRICSFQIGSESFHPTSSTYVEHLGASTFLVQASHQGGRNNVVSFAL